VGQRDMLLELSVLSYHRLSPRQVAVKRFDTVGGTLGRSEQADWYLPDPERVVSGLHAAIGYQSGQFSITDKSTNGLFINRSTEALGQGNTQVLHHGDIVCMGDYEIQVALIDEQAKVTTPQTNQSTALPGIKAFPAAEIVSAPLQQDDSGFRISELASTAYSKGETSPDLNARRHLGAQQNFAMDEHFLAPTATIPDDWEANWQQEGNLKRPLQSAFTPSHVSANSSNGTTATQHDYLQAFLKGLDVSEENQTAINSTQIWEQLGRALKQSLYGVIEVMRERSTVKSNFRVNQTTFQQRENNPLKFSASLDDAFHNLFNRPGTSFMPAQQAIAEAFADISRHELAIVAGASGAMVGLLQQLAPEKIEATDFGSSFVDKVNPAQRQARLWSQYKALHQTLVSELNSKNRQGVNDDFISAYEEFLRKK
jgi:type VI secretion system FHA domain protein